MDYMIYIYAALAFIIAGGSGFICFHAGHRIGRRESEPKYFTIRPEDYERKYTFVQLPRGAGREAHAARNPHIQSDFYDKRSPTLTDAIDAHLQIMDKDD